MEKQGAAEARDRAADLRDDAADRRDTAARARDEAAEQRDVEARTRDEAARRQRRSETDRLTERTLRDEEHGTEEGSDRAVSDTDAAHVFLDRLRTYEAAILTDRRAAAEDRHAAAEDRRAAARDRELAAWARQQAGVEAAQVTSEELARLTEQSTQPGAEMKPSSAPGSGTAHRAETASQSDTVERAETSSQEAALASARHAADLARQVAESEEKIAAILRSLAAHGDPTASDRRLTLADTAVSGMRAAVEHSNRLRGLAQRVADDRVIATLRTLLSHASSTSAAMAETEHSIADAMELLASHENPEAGAELRREAGTARAAAEQAISRARELRRLEQASGARAVGPPDEQPRTPD